MALDYDTVMSKVETDLPFSYTDTEAILYAVAVGMGRDERDVAQGDDRIAVDRHVSDKRVASAPVIDRSASQDHVVLVWRTAPGGEHDSNREYTRHPAATHDPRPIHQTYLLEHSCIVPDFGCSSAAPQVRGPKSDRSRDKRPGPVAISSTAMPNTQMGSQRISLSMVSALCSSSPPTSQR